MSDKDNFFESENFTFHVGGWEDFDGNHYNVDAGDPLPDFSIGVDYVSVQVDPEVNDGDLWVHIDGPFDDWDDVAEAIEYWYENGS